MDHRATPGARERGASRPIQPRHDGSDGPRAFGRSTGPLAARRADACAAQGGEAPDHSPPYHCRARDPRALGASQFASLTWFIAAAAADRHAASGSRARYGARDHDATAAPTPPPPPPSRAKVPRPGWS